MTLSIAGIGVAAGTKTAIAPAAILSSDRLVVEPTWILQSEIENEIRRFENAILLATEQLQSVFQHIPEDTPDDIQEFIDTHLLMLNDKTISEAPITLIRQEGCSAEWALHLHRNALVSVFDKMDDPYLKTRKDDLNYVVNQIMAILLGNKQSRTGNFSGRIVVAEDLTPADTILLHHQGARGFVTEHGSSISHTAILARSMGIPAIVGAHGVTHTVVQGETIVLDALNGILLAGCSPSDIRFFERRQDAERLHGEQLKALRNTRASTQDGLQLTLMANIELVDDVSAALENAAQGIGLYRTEFMYMNRELPPSEEEHFQAYRRVLQSMGGLPVTIRTLDLGADKQPGTSTEHGVCGNPALGLRAIRLCLKEPDIFRLQIRGMLRASVYGELRIMIPMLTNLDEARETRKLIEHEYRQLESTGLALPDIKIGAMVETPAAALLAADFARFFDFLSIGTNDLVQYTLAVDRANDNVSHLYDACHPAVIRLIAGIIDAGRQAGVTVSICGEMAADLRYLPLLVGLGLTHLSMEPSALLEVKNLLRSLDGESLARKAKRLLECGSVETFERELRGFLAP